jgi:hypothetical protein
MIVIMGMAALVAVLGGWLAWRVRMNRRFDPRLVGALRAAQEKPVDWNYEQPLWPG